MSLLKHALKDKQNIDAIQIVSEGGTGHFVLGTDVLWNETLDYYAPAITSWGNALKPGGDILLYGCDLAASAEGKTLVDNIARLTGADVAASTDLTGAANLGGDWQLEYQTGGITASALNAVGFQDTLATRVVTSLADDGGGALTTLREAVAAANGDGKADTIVFDPSLFADGAMHTITLTSGEMDISGNNNADAITILGPGADRLTISGNDKSRIFSAYNSTGATSTANTSAATLSGMTLTSGSAGGSGGAISSYYSGSLTLDHMIVKNSNTTKYGGGIRFYDGSGNLSISNSMIYGNTGGGGAGGIDARTSSTGSITIVDSAIFTNTNSYTGAGHPGGGAYLKSGSGTSTISNVTFYNNKGTAGSGAFIRGTGTVRNSTFTQNYAKSSISGESGAFFASSGTVSLYNNIFSGNTASGGGNTADLFGSNATIKGSNNIFGSKGSEISTPTNFTGLAATVAGSPNLGTFGFHGGFVKTVPILTSSSAIGAGLTTGAPTTDARGYGRGASIDIGAYEYSDNSTFDFKGLLFPANGFTNVPSNNNLVIDFGQAVTAVSGKNIVIYKSDNTVFETIAANDSSKVTIGAGLNGNSKVTINPAGAFASLTGYYVLIDSGAFIDGASKTFNGITSSAIWAFTSIVVSGPVATATNITITSTPTGTGSTYKVGDTVTAHWDNSAAGDNQSGVTGVTMDFSAFGGGSAVTATETSTGSNIWTVSYQIAAGSIDGSNKNVSVTVTDGTTPSTTADTANLKVDNQAPTVTDANISISGGTGGVYKIGDTVTATWNNTAATGDNNSDVSSATVDFSQFGGGSAVTATNSSGTWTATYTIVGGGSINGVTNRNVSVTATDDAGNTKTTADSSNATVDNLAPAQTVTITSISADTGTSATDYITKTAGQTINATLSGALGGSDKLYGSVNGGTSWTDVTSKVSGTTVTWDGATLGAGTSSIKFKVTDSAGNDGTVATQAYTLDTSGPTASVTAATIKNTAGVTTAQSTETGTAYLVLASAGVTDMASLETLVTGGTATKATVTAANTNTGISTTGLADGTYKVYAVDTAGNVSANSTNSIVIDTTAPSFTSSSTPSVAENTTAAVTLASTDNSSVTYSIVGGADQAKFSVTGTALAFQSAPNYENPTDTGDTAGNNTYVVTVRATDAAGNTTDQTLTVTVTDVNEAPTLTTINPLTGATEDTAYAITYSALLAASNAADVDAGGTTGMVFRVEAVSTGTLYTDAGLTTQVTAGTTTLGTGQTWYWKPTQDANGSGLNAFTVKAVDSGSLSSATAVQVTVDVAAVNDAPTAISPTTGSVSTFDSANAVAATLSATDVDNTTWTFSIQSITLNSTTQVNDGSLFNLADSTSVASTTLRATTPGTMTTGSYTVVVRATDAGGLFRDETLTVTVDSSLVVDVTAFDSNAPTGTYATDSTDNGGLDLKEALNFANNASGPVTIRFAATLSGTITLPANLTVKDGITLKMDSDTDNRSLIINTNGFALAGAVSVDVASGDSLTINSNLTDNGSVTSSLTKTGAGTLVLGGTNVTYSSGTPVATSLNTITVSGGKLQVTGQSNLCSGGITLQNGSTLAVTGGGGNEILNAFTLGTGGGTIEYGNTTGGAVVNLDGQISGSGKLIKTGAGVVGLTVGYATGGAISNSGWTGDLEVQAGTLALADKSWNYGGGNIIFDSGTTLYGIGDYGSINIANAVTVNGSVTIDMDGTTNVLTLSGTLTGANTPSLAISNGGKVVLSGNNSFSGSVSVTGANSSGNGQLVLSSATAISNDTAVTLNAYGKLQVTVDKTIGNLSSSVTTSQVLIDKTKTLTVNEASDTTFAGKITDGSGSGGGNLAKTGAGKLTLTSTTSNYSGTTTISNGTLSVSGGTAIPNTSAVTVNTGGTLDLAGNETIGSLTGAGNVTLGANTLTAGGDDTSTTFSGAISGTGGLSKAGGGTLTLSGTNTYSGTTTVSAGTLAVSNAAALGTSGGGTTVSSGAVLSIQGGITLAEALTLNGGGMSNTGALLNVSGANTLSGNVILASGSYIGVSAGTLTLNGVVSGAPIP